MTTPITPFWRLKCGLLYAGIVGIPPVIKLVDLDNASVFDSRDNREIKLRFYSAVSGYKFEVEEINPS